MNVRIVLNEIIVTQRDQHVREQHTILNFTSETANFAPGFFKNKYLKFQYLI